MARVLVFSIDAEARLGRFAFRLFWDLADAGATLGQCSERYLTILVADESMDADWRSMRLPAPFGVLGRRYACVARVFCWLGDLQVPVGVDGGRR
jgi:hypothetical protein